MCMHMAVAAMSPSGGPWLRRVCHHLRAVGQPPGTTTAPPGIVKAQHIALAPVASSTATASTTAPPREPEPRLADLMRDVREVIRHLDDPGAPGTHEPLRGVVARCNASLEDCLDTEREHRDRDSSAGAAKDELKRLAGLLAKVESADAAMVMRQIRRVLGRFDVRV
jgi:hypothetical protein